MNPKDLAPDPVIDRALCEFVSRVDEGLTGLALALGVPRLRALLRLEGGPTLRLTFPFPPFTPPEFPS